jgi:hypothetical protein
MKAKSDTAPRLRLPLENMMSPKLAYNSPDLYLLSREEAKPV